MTTDKEADGQSPAAFEKTLNRHGYGFQYSVLNMASNLFKQGNSRWCLEAVEFPVEVQGSGTRIDFVLRRNSPWDRCPFYLLAECKRVNPALSNWCFARAPFIRRNRSHEPLIIEKIQLDERNRPFAFAKSHSDLRNAYHIAIEVKSEEKGDSAGQGRGTIEEAATQICRGLNGMIEFFAKNLQIFGEYKSANFLPVIFTSAELWTTDTNLNEAEIETGTVTLNKSGIDRKPWLTYQYHMSPGLKHSYAIRNETEEIGEILDAQYIRTIPIVSSLGISEFLRWSSNQDIS